MTVKSHLVILGSGVGVVEEGEEEESIHGLLREDALNVCSCGLMLQDRAIKDLAWQQCFIE